MHQEVCLGLQNKEIPAHTALSMRFSTFSSADRLVFLKSREQTKAHQAEWWFVAQWNELQGQNGWMMKSSLATRPLLPLRTMAATLSDSVERETNIREVSLQELLNSLCLSPKKR